MDFTEAYTDRCSSVGHAARTGDVKSLKKLIKKGSSVDVPDNRGWMPVHEAAYSKSSQCLQLLINSAPSRSYIKAKTFEGESALHLAAKSGSVKCAQILLQAGADPNEVTNEETTPLFLAVEGGHKEVVKLLLKNKANINGSHSCSGWNPLHQASLMVSALFVWNIPPLNLESHLLKERHPLQFSGLHIKCIDHWILLEPSMNLRMVQGEQKCFDLVWERGCDMERRDIILLLLENGVDKECEDDFGITPAFIASQYGKYESLNLLLLHGANADCQAKDKATPLFIAAQEGHDKCVGLLLAKGADPNLYCNDDNWQLPIHAAAQMGRSKTLDLLLPVTDPASGVADGKVSPVYSAVYGGHKDCLEKLLMNGYNPEAQKCPLFGCETPMCMVFQRRHFDIVPVLLKYGFRLSSEHLKCCLQNKTFDLFRYFLNQRCPLPSGKEVAALGQYVCNAQQEWEEWLPDLLLAGFHPLHLLDVIWIRSVNDDFLNFTLEFTDWKRLPGHVEQYLSVQRKGSARTQLKPFETIPALMHLCRLQIRSLLTTDHLRSAEFICTLPLPVCLQDFLHYSDVLRKYAITRMFNSSGSITRTAGQSSD